MVNADIALGLRLKAVQGLGIDGDGVKSLTNVVERRLGFLENQMALFTAMPDGRELLPRVCTESVPMFVG